MAKSKSRRANPLYMPLAGYVLKTEGVRFKMVCAAKELNLSEGLDVAIKFWLDAVEKELGLNAFEDVGDRTVSPQQDTEQLPPEE